MPEINYYDALGINRDAHIDAIKVAYRKQSVFLHPDKNPYGAEMMKVVNEAKSVLLNERERAIYDRDLISGNHHTNTNRNRNRNNNRQDASPSVVRNLNRRLHDLQNRLAESENKRTVLQRTNNMLQIEVDDAMEEKYEALEELSEKNNQWYQLQRKQKKIENEINFHKDKSELLERKNRDQRRQMGVYQDKIDKAGRELRAERRKTESLTNDVKHTKKILSERSVCYRCNGEAVTKDDCNLCKGNGAIQGIWTKCHNCNGNGDFISITGEKKSCDICCLSKGAREGNHNMPCFKCKGYKGGEDCTVCYKGRIKGFNLMVCPMCRGKGECMNCFGRAYVSCNCGGPLCVGHKPNEIAKPTTSSKSSLQQKLVPEKDNEQDQVSGCTTRIGGSEGPPPPPQAPLPNTDPKVSEKENEKDDWVAEFRAANYSINPYVPFNVQMSTKNINLEKERRQKKKKKKRGGTTAVVNVNADADAKPLFMKPLFGSPQSNTNTEALPFALTNPDVISSCSDALTSVSIQ